MDRKNSNVMYGFSHAKDYYTIDIIFFIFNKLLVSRRYYYLIIHRYPYIIVGFWYDPGSDRDNIYMTLIFLIHLWTKQIWTTITKYKELEMICLSAGVETITYHCFQDLIIFRIMYC